MARKPAAPKQVEALAHDEVRRRLVPTAEQQSLVQRAEAAEPFPPQAYSRTTALPHGAFHPRDTDLDPQITWNGAEIVLTDAQIESLKAGDRIVLGEAQLTWRGKDQADWSDLVVETPPIYVQEHVEPKHLIDQLRYDTAVRREEAAAEPDLFGGAATDLEPEARTEFYAHDVDWKNRMILGDSLQAMASLSAREGMAGQVQCIYFDPPYGIKFQSNWQVSTRSRDVKDGKHEEITREPEQVRAFRDTWKDGIHSYLTYLRDRLTVMRDMLTESGSIFVQIGDENVHRVRAVMDEVFGEENFVRLVTFRKTTGQTDSYLASVSDYLVWYSKDRHKLKFRKALKLKELDGEGGTAYNSVRNVYGETRRLLRLEKSGDLPIPADTSAYRIDNLTSQSPGTKYEVTWHGKRFFPKGYWKTQESSIGRLLKADRAEATENALYYVRLFNDYRVFPYTDNWDDTVVAGFSSDKRYVVETSEKVVQRCILMTTDPGDLVLDPTCGSGTTATVAEQWGRRWITMDTSRVALALARARLMGARYPYYLLRDTPEGQAKEASLTGAAPPTPIPPRPAEICARASSTSARPTSPSSPSPTTPRSTRSGRTPRPGWSRSATCSTQPWAAQATVPLPPTRAPMALGRNGRSSATPATLGLRTPPRPMRSLSTRPRASPPASRRWRRCASRSPTGMRPVPTPICSLSGMAPPPAI
ncbi:site-specific DNA-methyltransferase [uncultured Jannaschia sp.]|uniref:DNA methyltransferase n=1 Tax=uncultured Jannaschia sp. TaxID=293347 RepID=UPI00260C9E12|nr:site-specific DNA-methyltransferase [uncultured Jannaschia sp.]